MDERLPDWTLSEWANAVALADAGDPIARRRLACDAPRIVGVLVAEVRRCYGEEGRGLAARMTAKEVA